MNASKQSTSPIVPEHRYQKIMHYAPLWPVAVGLMAGILLENQFPFTKIVYGGLLFGATILSLHRIIYQKIATVLIFVASMGVGGLLYQYHLRDISPDSIERFVTNEGVFARIRGVVISEPRQVKRPESHFSRWSFRSHQTVFLLNVESVEGTDGYIHVTGTIRVSVREPMIDLSLHDRVELFGRLYTFHPPSNPGSFDWASYQRRQGVLAGLSCPHRENIQYIFADPSVDVHSPGIQQRFRNHVRGLLTGDLTAASTQETSSLLETMVLGQRSQLDRRVNDIFIRAGCVHFLAVSGLHLAIPMSFVWLIGRLFSISKKKCAWLMIVTIIAYLVVAEPRPSILRASVMGLMFTLSILLGRQRSGLNWLSASAVILLIHSPGMIFDIGFQLSFIAILGITSLSGSILVFFKGLRNWIEFNFFHQSYVEQDRQLADSLALHQGGWSALIFRMRSVVVRYVWFPLSVAIGAWLATIPIVSFQFNQFHGWAPVYSILLFPFVYVIVIISLLKIGMGTILPGAESIFTQPLLWFDTKFIQFVEWLGSLPGSTIAVSPPSGWWITAYYLFLVLFVFRFQRIAKNNRYGTQSTRSFSLISLRRLNYLCVASLVLFFIAHTLRYFPVHRTKQLEITVLSVGAGSATVIELPDGRTFVYDVGSSTWPAIGKSAIVPFLRQKGIHRIDRVYLSHANIDHYNGLLDLMDVIPTGTVYVTEYFIRHSSDKSPSRYLLDQLQKSSQTVTLLDPSSRVWSEGDHIKFELLWPPSEYDETLSSNDASMVLRITYAGHSILLTGDIEDRAQRALMNQDDLHADILILPHHGSVRSSTPSFVESVNASVAIRSSNQRMSQTFNGIDSLVRRSGHRPDGSAIDSIARPDKSSSSLFFNTADVGAVSVIFYSNREDIFVYPHTPR